MGIVLTERMKAWIERMGCHLCVATPEGVPFVTVARFAHVTKPDQVSFAMEKGEIRVIEEALIKNPWVAFGVSKQGGIRAAYQFKGKGKVLRSGAEFEAIKGMASGIATDAVLIVDLAELYCTKPGAEAGQRLDIMTPEVLVAWEKARWTDIPGK
ncbi:hypothetical protein [Methanospirillum sp.]|uniref:hypothetical protein n=1 Tax=Methanospirillum sp. TaxID=45200 RepID=UPI002C52B95C|nr:hypothetical protein [Methanospirillum sp.]HPP78633.1 hypothetical protein [Methanospirillum sp.]